MRRFFSIVMCATAVFCSAEAFAQAQKSDKDLKKELKKKDVPTITISEEQRKLLSSLFPDIDSLFS